MSKEDETSLAAIDELMDPILRGTWEWSTHRKEDNSPIASVEDVAETLSVSARKGSLAELHGVVVNVNGEDVVVCYTGNGPTSAAHARFIANARDIIAWLRAALAEKEKEAQQHQEHCLCFPDRHNCRMMSDPTLCEVCKFGRDHGIKPILPAPSGQRGEK